MRPKQNSTAAVAFSITRKISGSFISCVLVVTEKLIRERPEWCAISCAHRESGEWAEAIAWKQQSGGTFSAR